METQPYKGEHLLTFDDYEYILDVTKSMGLAMERAPQSFAMMDEEHIRNHFLLQLNGHYEGSALGETFNASGKTDILIRVDDKNIFIGECKFWEGSKAFSETVDQLFSYTGWRDTKLAVVMFVREKGLTGVVEKAREALGEHDQFVEWTQAVGETELRATMSWPGDERRHADLNVFFVHLPRH